MTEYILKHISIPVSPHKGIDTLMIVISNTNETNYYVQSISNLHIPDNTEYAYEPMYYTVNYMIYKTTDINLFKDFLTEFKAIHMV